ncbi:MAG: phosphoribosylanthranilate isomerase [Olsenella sp.]|nr:phosphoribosylanthranilate isomerase [Olsenella sp.]
MFNRHAATVVMREMLAEGVAPTRVMLTGMFLERDVAAVNAAGPDLCGFTVNLSYSRRNVAIGRLASLVRELDPKIPAVGLFVDQPIGMVAELADTVLDLLELGGSEDDAYIRAVRNLVDIPICQRIRLDGPAAAERANASTADIVMLKGSWYILTDRDLDLIRQVNRPYILSGGLTPGNLRRTVDLLSPWGVDLDTGIEQNGFKSAEKIASAIGVVRGSSQ